MNDDKLTSADEQAWAAQFDATVEQIREAVRTVGANKAEVEMYLKGTHSSTDAEIAKRAGA